MNLVYFSPVPWRSFSQRPHKFVEWAHARFDAHVLWIDPYPTRFPAWNDLYRLTAGGDVVVHEPRQVHASHWLTVVKPLALPIEPAIGLARLNRLLWRRILRTISDFLSVGDRGVIAVGKPSDLAIQALRRHRAVLSVFDAMDDYPAFYDGAARRAMELNTHRVASLVSRLMLSSRALASRFVEHRSKSRWVPNACDASALPSFDTNRRESGPPVLGYVGTIGHWFDWSLVCALAEAGSPVRIHLIGPLHARPPRALPDNVELLPTRDHGAAVQAMQGFTAGLIPFKVTGLTRSVDSIKYYEYRALGLPVISTRFGEMGSREREPGVYLVEARTDPAPQIRSALGYRCDRDEVLAFRDANTWTARFDACGILSP